MTTNYIFLWRGFVFILRQKRFSDLKRLNKRDLRKLCRMYKFISYMFMLIARLLLFAMIPLFHFMSYLWELSGFEYGWPCAIFIILAGFVPCVLLINEFAFISNHCKCLYTKCKSLLPDD